MCNLFAKLCSLEKEEDLDPLNESFFETDEEFFFLLGTSYEK